MKFNYHGNLEGTHAFLSPSKYSWINYDDEKMEAVYANWRASLQGTELHELAAKMIRLNVKLPKIKKTLNMYVNDAIGYRMFPKSVCSIRLMHSEPQILFLLETTFFEFMTLRMAALLLPSSS